MKFRFGKSIKNDYALFLSLILFIIGTLFLLFISIGPQSYRLINLEYIIQDGILVFNFKELITAIIFVIMIVVSLICFIKRVFYIESFTREECRRVSAKVVNIKYIKDRCGVDFEFVYEGVLCKKHFALMNNSQTKYIHMDSEVELIIKDGNPKKSLIAELYFDENN